MENSKQTNNQYFSPDLMSLLQTVKTLRGPEGCPWDKAQTHASLSAYAIEEAYELAQVLDKIDTASLSDLKHEDLEKDFIEELGDYFFQVLLHCEIKDQVHHLKAFSTFELVIQRLNKKLIHRHPHVFTENKISDIPDVWKKWEEIKLSEKKNKNLVFTHPIDLPALQSASKIGQKAKNYDFDWLQPEDVLQKVNEELRELESAINNRDTENIKEELGDLLFSLAQLSRHLNLDPEQSLRLANEKFMTRFLNMIKISGLSITDFQKSNRELKESLWNKVKKLFS